MSTTQAEEYDPKTGEFRPIRRPHPRSSAEIASGRREPKQRRVPVKGLSESGQKYGVFYEIFEDMAKTKTAKYMELGTKIFLVVMFVLLIYQAVSYRWALAFG